MAAKRRKKRRSARDVDTEDIESRIFDVAESSPYVRLLAYGKNGKGKTRLAASFPKTLIIDVNEEGTRSAKDSNSRVFPAKSWSDIAAVYWYLQKGDHPYETVAIDTLTQMQVLAMRRAMKEKVERDPEADPKQPRIQDYGKANTMMGEMILMFRNLPMHVVFLAQERVVGDPEEGEVEVHVPDMPNGSRGHAMGAVGIIGRLYQREMKVTKKGKKRTTWAVCMLVGPHEEYESKDRTNALGRIVVNPTGPKIIKAWAEGDHEDG